MPKEQNIHKNYSNNHYCCKDDAVRDFSHTSGLALMGKDSNYLLGGSLGIVWSS